MHTHARRLALAFFFTTFSWALWAQTTAPSLTGWNTQRLQRNQRAMWVLASWGVANLAVGAVAMGRAQGEQRAFHQMNAGWGLINGALAASGLWTAMHTDPASLTAWESLRAHDRMQHILLFNAGLDVGYMMAGAWMQERAKNTLKNPERWRGWGKSIVLQGAFLFAFDLGAYLYHQPLRKGFQPLLSADGVGMLWQF